MTAAVTALVLFSALCHASWNAIIRAGGDKVIAVSIMLAAAAILVVPGLFILPVPNREAWIFLAISTAIHTGYNLGLALAYSHADLGRTYPLVRGSAPLLTLIVAPLIVSDSVPAASALGIVVLAAGIITLAFERGLKDLLASPKGLVYSLLTSLCITGYTISDGMGARASDNPHSYVIWLFLLDAIPLVAFALIWRRKDFLGATGRDWGRAFAGGALSIGAYWIAIWAMTVAPIPVVAALRETSILFATLIGVVFLGEKLTLVRAVSVTMVLAGLVLMRF